MKDKFDNALILGQKVLVLSEQPYIATIKDIQYRPRVKACFATVSLTSRYEAKTFISRYLVRINGDPKTKYPEFFI